MQQRVAKLVVLASLAIAVPVRGIESEFQGQLSGSLLWTPDASVRWQAGIRYLPELTLEQELGPDCRLDALLSLDVRGLAWSDADHDIESDLDADPYRLWLRVSLAQYELRAGLQKINFGPAMLLRPLRWFDQIDPRDPLGITDGVYGLLGRYYFLNNVQLWAWGLYGNDDLKGWEIMPSVETEPELGGRLQVPLLGGEIGVAFHHRIARTMMDGGIIPGLLPADIVENRLGVDARWDVGVGLWIEAATSRADQSVMRPKYTSLAAVGLDYTVGWGNGLYLLCEHMIARAGEEVLDSDADFSAMLLSYPIGLVDSVRYIVNYDWSTDDWYHFVAWERLYDDWALHINVFEMPGETGPPQTAAVGSLAGTGVQVLLVLNH